MLARADGGSFLHKDKTLRIGRFGDQRAQTLHGRIVAFSLRRAGKISNANLMSLIGSKGAGTCAFRVPLQVATEFRVRAELPRPERRPPSSSACASSPCVTRGIDPEGFITACQR